MNKYEKMNSKELEFVFLENLERLESNKTRVVNFI